MKGGGSFGGRSSGSPYGGKYISAQKNPLFKLAWYFLCFNMDWVLFFVQVVMDLEVEVGAMVVEDSKNATRKRVGVMHIYNDDE